MQIYRYVTDLQQLTRRYKFGQSDTVIDQQFSCSPWLGQSFVQLEHHEPKFSFNLIPEGREEREKDDIIGIFIRTRDSSCEVHKKIIGYTA